MADSLVIEVTAGPEDPERCNQAFTVAAGACAVGVPVEVWLSGPAARLAVPGQAGQVTLQHAAALPDLIGMVLEAGAITVCTQSAARCSVTAADLLTGVRIAGTASYLERIMRPGTRVVVY